MTTDNRADVLALATCKHCGYSVPPREVKFEERKHYHGHAFQCLRCLFQSETGATWAEAREKWNTRTLLHNASFPLT
jgi:hypothetical protein